LFQVYTARFPHKAATGKAYDGVVIVNEKKTLRGYFVPLYPIYQILLLASVRAKHAYTVIVVLKVYMTDEPSGVR
jgi:hypothetical protein